MPLIETIALTAALLGFAWLIAEAKQSSWRILLGLSCIATLGAAMVLQSWRSALIDAEHRAAMRLAEEAIEQSDFNKVHEAVKAYNRPGQGLGSSRMFDVLTRSDKVEPRK